MQRSEKSAGDLATAPASATRDEQPGNATAECPGCGHNISGMDVPGPRHDLASKCVIEAALLASWLVKSIDKQLEEFADEELTAASVVARRVQSLLNGACSALNDAVDHVEVIEGRVFPRRVA